MTSSARAILITTIAGLAAVCLAAALHAEPQPAPPSAPKTDQPATPPQTAEPAADPSAPSVLGGPKVADKTERLTIVQRDSEGKLVRLEDRPEIIALPLLKLSGDAKKAADKVVNEHGVLIAKALNEHQALFLQIQNARQSGDIKSAGPQIRELHQKAPELFEPALLDKLTRALPVEKAAQLRSIVTEYFVAIADEPGPDGRGPRRPAAKPAKEGSGSTGGGGGMMMQGDNEGGMMQGGGGGGGGGIQGSAGDDSPMPPEPSLDAMALRRIESNLVMREMARSLKTLTEMRREQTDRLLAGLGLTPEQDSKIHAVIRETGRKAKDGQPSPEDHRALIEEIKKLLTVEQQRQLQQNLRNR